MIERQPLLKLEALLEVLSGVLRLGPSLVVFAVVVSAAAVLAAVVSVAAVSVVMAPRSVLHCRYRQGENPMW